MRRRHLFAFYCTILVPVGVLAGAGAGHVVGFTSPRTILGAAGGVMSSWLLLRGTSPAESP